MMYACMKKGAVIAPFLFLKTHVSTQCLRQINHVSEQDAVFDNRFRIIGCKEIPDSVGSGKTAFLIKTDRFWHVACADLHRCIFWAAGFYDMVYEAGSISPMLRFRCGRQIFEFTQAIAFVGDDTDAFQLVFIIKGEKFTPVEITADHILIGVGKQKQSEKLVFVVCDPFYFHGCR